MGDARRRRQMGLINPTPLTMTITLNEISGTIDMKTSRPVIFARAVRIFAAVLQQLATQAEQIEARGGGGLITGDPGGNPPGDLSGNPGGGLANEPKN